MFEENRFENVLKSLRVRKGKEWTQAKTARLLGVSRRTYVGWENGESIPSQRDLKNIATTLELNEGDESRLYHAAAQVPPEIHNLPLVRNTFFTGRKTQLEQLGQSLKEDGSVALTQPISISGLGGIGKTQLALEYAHRCYPSVYRAVFWVNAADRTTLQADYDNLAHLLKLPERSERETDQRIQAVKRWLEGHSCWLLILDNADDLQLASSFMPVMPRGHIILTTRSQIVRDSNIAIQIEIEEMEPAEGQLFLLLRSGILQDKTKLDTLDSSVRDSAIELVTLLGGHPLALDQAGAFIEETRVSLADYIQRYREARQYLLNRRGSLGSTYREGKHPESVAATFELSFNKAFKQHPMATDILYFCAFLQPDAIPEELLHQDDGLRIDATSFNEGIAALLRYSLIKRNTQDKTLSMHRLVQAVLLDSMSPDLRKQWRERVVQALNEAFPEVEFKEWTRCGRLLPHVLICATWTETELTSILDASHMLHKAGDYLRERARYSEAEALLTGALMIREQHLGAEHLDTARTLNELALLYWQQGKYEQAEPLYQRALSIRERHLGEHPDTANSLSDLAVLYRQQGKYEQAEMLYQRALIVREQHLGDHPDTAWSLSTLADFYRQQGKFEQAEPLLLRALSIREEQLGPEHPDTARSLHGLAKLLQDQGKHERAEALYQRAYRIQEQRLGATHQHIQETRKDYAKFLRSIGRDAEAVAVESRQS